MRLPAVERGPNLKTRLFFGFLRVVTGGRAPDVVRTIRFRPQQFGQPFSEMVHQTLRGPSEWTVGERELFAAFVSRLNQCLF